MPSGWRAYHAHLVVSSFVAAMATLFISYGWLPFDDGEYLLIVAAPLILLLATRIVPPRQPAWVIGLASVSGMLLAYAPIYVWNEALYMCFGPDGSGDWVWRVLAGLSAAYLLWMSVTQASRPDERRWARAISIYGGLGYAAIIVSGIVYTTFEKLPASTVSDTASWAVDIPGVEAPLFALGAIAVFWTARQRNQSHRTHDVSEGTVVSPFVTGVVLTLIFSLAAAAVFGVIEYLDASSQLAQTQNEYDAYRAQVAKMIKSEHLSINQNWSGKPHVRLVQEDGAAHCFGCHDEVYCSDCHVSQGPKIMEQ